MLESIDLIVSKYQEISKLLQSELSNLGYYNSAIDGDWGPESRVALSKYLINKSLEGSNSIFLEIGCEGELVITLQRTLNDLKMLQINVSGVFDKYTEYLVKIVQAGNGLPINGVVDRLTWEAILEGA